MNLIVGTGLVTDLSLVAFIHYCYLKSFRCLWTSFAINLILAIETLSTASTVHHRSPRVVQLLLRLAMGYCGNSDKKEEYGSGRKMVHKAGVWTKEHGCHGSLTLFINRAASLSWTDCFKIHAKHDYFDFFLDFGFI